jgi:hypothetical protein
MASGSILLNSYYAHEPGGSPSWLLRVRTDRTESGWAVVKVCGGCAPVATWLGGGWEVVGGWSWAP